jgi:hypothetical protein
VIGVAVGHAVVFFLFIVGSFCEQLWESVGFVKCVYVFMWLGGYVVKVIMVTDNSSHPLQTLTT